MSARLTRIERWRRWKLARFHRQQADLSSFKAVVDLGGFVHWAVACVAIGLGAIGLSFLVPGEVSE